MQLNLKHIWNKNNVITFLAQWQSWFPSSSYYPANLSAALFLYCQTGFSFLHKEKCKNVVVLQFIVLLTEMKIPRYHASMYGIFQPGL